jgi:hypothetical protein
MTWQAVDDTNNTIQITLWGKEIIEANTYLKAGDVVAIKVAKVSEYGGISLNLSGASAIYQDIEHKRYKQMKEWTKK